MKAEWGNPYDTLLRAGQYRAAYLGYEPGPAYGRTVWFCHFQLTEEGTDAGKPLLRCYNAPTRTWIARSSNLWIDFTAVMGQRPPALFRPDDFLKGCEVLAKVVTVKHRTEGKRRVEFPEGCWYSKIDRIVRITAGSPPCLRGQK